MHRADNPIIQTSPTVPATAAVQPGRKEERIQVGVAHGQEFNDESSESGDTTGGDSTADEDGWESGECRSAKTTTTPPHTQQQNTTTTPPPQQQQQHVDLSVFGDVVKLESPPQKLKTAPLGIIKRS